MVGSRRREANRALKRMISRFSRLRRSEESAAGVKKEDDEAPVLDKDLGEGVDGGVASLGVTGDGWWLPPGVSDIRPERSVEGGRPKPGHDVHQGR